MMELNLKSLSESGIERNVKGTAMDPSELLAILGEFTRVVLSNTNVGLRLVLLSDTIKPKGEDEHGDNDNGFAHDRN